MHNLDSIKTLPYWEGVAAHALNRLCNNAEVINVEEGAVVTQQFQSATDFYVLCSGSVDHYLTLLTEKEISFPVGKLDTPWSAIGWSSLVEPHRYTTQVICSSPSTLIRWNHETIQNLAKLYPEISRGLLRLVAESGKTLLEQSRRLMKQNSTFIYREAETERTHTPRLRLKLDLDKAINYLSYSSLFQELKLFELKRLADHCWLQKQRKGSIIFSEQEPADDVLILIKGTVTLCYTTNELTTDSQNSSKIFVRTLSQPGQVVSWAALTQSRCQDITAIASEDVSLCCVSASFIHQFCLIRTDFAIKLQKKLIQIVSSRLRSTRALLINQQTGCEHTTVTSLIHNVGPQLSIHSSLHKLPYLLQNRMTQEDAFLHLECAQRGSNQIEKNVAGLCYDVLLETRREYEFYKGLKSIYDLVTGCKNTEDPGALRNKSAGEFVKLFSNTRYLIKGLEFLPATGGHIFIMNHLVSHPYHKLPNGFEFSLDTHFLSSMILYKNYGDSGVRIVRKNRHDEYGHDSYYKKLGHIYAYTSESQTIINENTMSSWRDNLFVRATEHLQQGDNIIMCPEGTSYWSDESPGPFKSGAFRLAAMQNTETLIVPVVVANFDKKLSEAVYTAEIKQPFKIGDVVDVNDPDAMNLFLATLNRKYKTYFDETQKLSRLTD